MDGWGGSYGEVIWVVADGPRSGVFVLTSDVVDAVGLCLQSVEMFPGAHLEDVDEPVVQVCITTSGGSIALVDVVRSEETSGLAEQAQSSWE
jgi:hypothetical protein